jgi:hypothetical protein
VSDKKIAVEFPKLLLKAGILTTHDLSEAVSVSKRLNVPTTRVLLSSGVVSEEVMKIAQDLQSLLDDELIDVESATKSLLNLASGKLTADEVLDQIYALPRFAQGTKALGELLQAAEIVSAEQLEQALDDCGRTKAPLVSTLVLRGVLSAGFFPVIYRIQDGLRKGKIGQAQAIDQLKKEFAFFKRADESQRFAVLQSESTMRTLKDGHRRSSQSKLEAVGPSHVDPSSYVVLPTPPPSIAGQTQPAETVAHLQRNSQSTPRVTKSDKQERTQAKLLLEVIQQALNTIENSPQSAELLNMLNQAGLIESASEEVAVQRVLADPIALAKFFQAAGFIRGADFESVKRCYQSMVGGDLTVDAAVHALKLSRELRIPVDKILEDQAGRKDIAPLDARRQELIAGFVAGSVAALAGIAVVMLIWKRR